MAEFDIVDLEAEQTKEEGDGDTFDLDSKTALNMAANILFDAMNEAARRCDIEAMISVAAGWVEIHDRLNMGDEEEKPKEIGFSGFGK